MMKFIKKSFDILNVLRSDSYKNEDFSFLDLSLSESSHYNSYTIPKIIWLYWDSEEIPLIVDICLREIKSRCDDFEVILLNENTVKDFIDVPVFHRSLGKANVSDFIRLKLLYEYGGFWMDASILLNDNFDWILKNLTSQDAFLFYSDDCTKFINSPIFENWFIACPKNSVFIRDWLEEYTKCIKSNEPKNYYSHLLEDEYVMQNISKPEYLLAYISASVIYNKNKYSYNILTLPSSKVGHYYSYKHSFDGFKVAIDLVLKNRNRIFTPKLIKLNSSSRISIGKMLSFHFFSKKSLFGNIICGGSD